MRLALIAHDRLKPTLLSVVSEHVGLLSSVALTSTQRTAEQLQSLGLSPDVVRSGPLGGDLQIAVEVMEGRIDAVVFLEDRGLDHPHASDIASLHRVCALHGVPVAGTPATAQRLLAWVATVVWADPKGWHDPLSPLYAVQNEVH